MGKCFTSDVVSGQLSGGRCGGAGKIPCTEQHLSYRSPIISKVSLEWEQCGSQLTRCKAEENVGQTVVGRSRRWKLQDMSGSFQMRLGLSTILASIAYERLEMESGG